MKNITIENLHIRLRGFDPALAQSAVAQLAPALEFVLAGDAAGSSSTLSPLARNIAQSIAAGIKAKTGGSSAAAPPAASGPPPS